MQWLHNGAFKIRQIRVQQTLLRLKNAFIRDFYFHARSPAEEITLAPTDYIYPVDGVIFFHSCKSKVTFPFLES